MSRTIAPNRPTSVTIIGCLFIATGVMGIVYHFGEFKTLRPSEYALICFVRLLAIVGGIFLLGGRNWARWLLIAWMAYHVALSALHTPVELIVHAVLLVVISFFLFRPRVSAYLRSGRAQPL